MGLFFSKTYSCKMDLDLWDFFEEKENFKAELYGISKLVEFIFSAEVTNKFTVYFKIRK